MAINKRAGKRVGFDQSFGSTLMGVDGTWSLNCRVEDISASGAKVRIFSSIAAKMRAEEFFLMVTSDGKVKRRSKLVWDKGRNIGLEFIVERDH